MLMKLLVAREALMRVIGVAIVVVKVTIIVNVGMEIMAVLFGRTPTK